MLVNGEWLSDTLDTYASQLLIKDLNFNNTGFQNRIYASTSKFSQMDGQWNKDMREKTGDHLKETLP